MNFPSPEDASILFHNEDNAFILDNQPLIRQWIRNCFVQEGKELSFLNVIFCSDIYLKKININYLNHNCFTDTITFPYEENPVEGDIFISIDRVRENARSFQCSFEEELFRVMIHGVLHLFGYSDKTEAEQLMMRQLENKFLAELELLNNENN